MGPPPEAVETSASGVVQMIDLWTPQAGTIDRVGELADWLIALDRPMAFLLALPFMVALVGLVGEFVRRHL